MTTALCDIAMAGLGVMGKNLALNMADHGFSVVVNDYNPAIAPAFAAEHPAGSFGSLGGSLRAAADYPALVAALKRPRKIMIMVPAGGPTDSVINNLIPLLERGDIIIDGGNADWNDTIRREKALKEKGLRFVGSGVSGGETGARFGPSLMPGGDPESWNEIKPIWTAIAAKVDPKTGKPIDGAAPGKPVQVQGADSCSAYMGANGAGHYVKMVHNGIEYADMQLIAEAYHLLREVLALAPDKIADIFAKWNTGELDSFLIEITADVLRQKDPATGRPFVDVVLDAAGQKGTGQWTSTSALNLGVPAATMAEAVFARNISSLKDQRLAASRILKGPERKPRIEEPQRFIDAVGHALYCSKICCYAQGFQLLAAAAAPDKFNWQLDYRAMAMIWRGGCIIRARFLQKIKEAYDKDARLANLLLDPFFAGVIQQHQHDWRWVIATAIGAGLPVPAFSSALSYYDSYRTAVLPANLIQAQRDCFGAHTYERTDQPRGSFFHLEWTNPTRTQTPIKKPAAH